MTQPKHFFEIWLDIEGQVFKDLGKGFAEIDKFLRKMKSGNVVKIMKDEVDTFVKLIVEKQKLLHSRPWPAGTTASSLSRRSGVGLKHMKGYVKGSVSAGAESVHGVISNLQRMAFHEKAGWINVRNKKFLAIPIADALRENTGTNILPSPWMWKGTFLLRGRNGKLYIARRNKGQRRVFLMYALRKRVYVPPRLGLEKMVNMFLPKLGEGIIKRFDEELRKTK